MTTTTDEAANTATKLATLSLAWEEANEAAEVHRMACGTDDLLYEVLAAKEALARAEIALASHQADYALELAWDA